MTKILFISKNTLPSRRPNNGIEEASFPFQSAYIRKVCAEAESAHQSKLSAMAESIAEYVGNMSWESFYTPYEEEINSGKEVPSIGAWVETSQPITHVKIEAGRFTRYLKKAFKERGLVVV